MTNLMINPVRMSRQLDNVFDRFFNSEEDCSNGHGLIPRVAITDSDEEVRLVFEIPGMAKEDIKVSIKDKLLTVAGERKFAIDENSREIRNELRTGSFSRSFTLPVTVDPGKISADYHAGILDVRLAKREESKPREIEVAVK